MGNPRNMTSDSGFSIHLYTEHKDWQEVTINGIKAKVIRNISDLTGTHTSLPLAAGKSDMYLRLDKYGTPVQVRLYVDRFSAIDFDWGHDHYNNPKKGGNGQSFPKGTVHIQEYKFKHDGSADRISVDARFMNLQEIIKYGAVLKHFNPHIKFK